MATGTPRFTIGPTLHSRYMRSGYGAISFIMKALVDIGNALPQTSVIDSRSAKQTSTSEHRLHLPDGDLPALTKV